MARRSNRFTPFDVKKLLNSMATAARAITNDEFIPDVVIPELQEFIQQQFDKTINHWEGGAGGLGKGGSSKTYVEPAPPQLKFEVEKTTVGASITAYVDSYIWNLLDQGRDDRVTKKKEVFVPRTQQRTIPGTLDVSGNRNYEKVVYVPKGTTIEGFKPRKWTQLIEEAVEKEFSRKYPHVKFSFTLKEQDLGR